MTDTTTMSVSLLFLLACLSQNVFGSEIIRGQKVPDGLMLYMASVQSSRGHVCGGFLVNEEFVVTAAHCNKENLKNVILGTHNLRKVHDATMKYDIIKKCVHPDYVKTAHGNDIMLLQLHKKPKLDNRIQPVQLPRTNAVLKEKLKCRVAGWGGNRTGGASVNALQVVTVPIINLDTCKGVWKSVGVNLPANVICAGGFETDKGFCQGDSGGPLVHGGTAVGVVSFNYKKNCSYPNAPNVYTDVSKYLGWINKVLKTKKCK